MSAAVHFVKYRVEIELKLLVDDAGMRRLRRAKAFVEARRGVTRSARVVTTYYDTSGRFLWHHGLALRLRRDGKRWIQTLKGGGGEIGGLHRREEFEWLLSGDVLDLELLASTPYAGLFKRPRICKDLAPQFTTEFHRSSVELALGADTRAVLCCDRGCIRAGRSVEAISEVEIELISGSSSAILDFSLRLLEDLPFRIGVSSKAARGFELAAHTPRAPQRYSGELPSKHEFGWASFAACVQAATTQVHANEAGFLLGRDPEFLHQMRVGLRRLRVALALPHDQAWRAASAPLRARLRTLSVLLGEARNWDMFFLEVLRTMAAHLGVPAIAALRARAVRCRMRARGRARAAVLAGDYTALWIELARLMDGADESRATINGMSAREFADSALARRYEQLIKAGVGKDRGADLHALRIAAKKLRYSCDFFSGIYPKKKVKRFVADLVSMQDVLGRVNDAVVSLGLIEAASIGRRELDPRSKGLAQGWVGAGEAQALEQVDSVVQDLINAGIFWKP